MTQQQQSSGGGVAIGIAFGTVGAVAASYLLGNSFGWIIWHGIMGWWYLLYLCGGCGGGFPALP